MEMIYSIMSSSAGVDGPRLICPICGYFNSHIDRAERHHEEMIWGKHGGLAVKIDGECSHSWYIVFNEHKGDVFIETWYDKHQWVNVKDRLPPNDVQCNYLVRTKGDHYDIAFWYAWEQEEGDWLGVTHWMPVPELIINQSAMAKSAERTEGHE